MQDSALEPVNGEVTDAALKTSLAAEENDSSSEGPEEEIPPLTSSGETGPSVPRAAESSKAPEATLDQVGKASPQFPYVNLPILAPFGARR